MKSLLQIENLQAAYGRSQVLFGVNLEVYSGTVVSLLGRNGMGKTTTIRSLLGITQSSSGKVRFSGQEVQQWPAYRISRLGIGLVPEGRQIFPLLTVRENLLATAANRHNLNSAWDLKKVYDLFPILRNRRDQLGKSLSGGEQQMLAIGRALMTNPKLLILDEATSALDAQTEARIEQAIQGLHCTQIVVAHRLSTVRDADIIIVLDHGKIVQRGCHDALLKEEGSHYCNLLLLEDANL